jgi:hypothetical protein
VSLLGLRRRLGRVRRRREATLAVFAIAASIALHHSAMPLASHGHHAIGPVAEFCLGVVTVVGVAAAAAAFGLLPFRRREPLTLDASGLVPSFTAPEPRARAGPSALSVLCVFRN